MNYNPKSLFSYRYPHEELVDLLGEGCDKKFFSYQRQAYADKCSQLLESAKAFELSLEAVQHIETIEKRIVHINSFMGDKNYSQILRKLLSRCGWSLEVALAEEFKDLKRALQTLQYELKSAKEKVANEKADFGIAENEGMDSLKEYIRVAESIRETEEIKVLEEKMHDLAYKRRGGSDCPFVLLCASSGTGKTNMALSLKRLFLYFLYDLDSDQPVSKCFREQSRHLKELFNQDLKKYSRDLKYGAHWIRPFKSVGFLVEFIRMLKDLYDSSPPGTNAAELQVLIRSIDFGPISVEDGRLALRELFKSEHYYFPIIIDECALSSNCSDEEADQFTFMRSILCCLFCMPVFIGTNAQAACFRGRNENPSFGDVVDPSCWCLVWHHPPGVPKNLMTEAFGKIREKVRLWRQPKESAFPSDKLLDFLEKYLAMERPIFLIYAERYFEFFCNSVDSHCDSDEEFLALLVEDIWEQFICSKGSIPWINIGQLAYMSSMFTQTRDGDLVKSKFDSDRFIHGHLGYLSALPDDWNFRKYTKFRIDFRSYDYKLKYFKGIRNYDISTRFESLNSTPLTGLMVAGVTADNQRILCKKRPTDENLECDPRKRNVLSLKRISLLAAIKKSKSSVSKYSPATHGFKLDMALFTSTILASRGEGFKGCRFDLFLEHLAREFDFGGKYGDGVKPPSIVFHNDFPESILRKQIPFLPSMCVNEWDEKLATHLLELFGAYLGIADVSVTEKEEGCDMIVTEYSNRSIVFAGSMYTAPVDVEHLEKRILKTFKKYPTCDLFLAAAPGFTNIHSFNQRRTLLWEFEQNGDDLHIIPAKTNINWCLKATKHIIMLDMHMLSKAKPNKIDNLIAEFQTEIKVRPPPKEKERPFNFII